VHPEIETYLGEDVVTQIATMKEPMAFLQRLWMPAKLMSAPVCFEPTSKNALYQGTTLVVPKRAGKYVGF
jgi:hypothetical protein